MNPASSVRQVFLLLLSYGPWPAMVGSWNPEPSFLESILGEGGGGQVQHLPLLLFNHILWLCRRHSWLLTSLLFPSATGGELFFCGSCMHPPFSFSLSRAIHLLSSCRVMGERCSFKQAGGYQSLGKSAMVEEHPLLETAAGAEAWETHRWKLLLWALLDRGSCSS